jgi:Fe-S-cluster containining protein
MSAFEYVQAATNNLSPTTMCNNCIGACCMKGNALGLSPDEAQYLKDQGTELALLDKSELPRALRRSIEKDKEFYELRSDCGNLDPETRQCTDYDNRPQACRDFRASPVEYSPCHTRRSVMAGRIAAGRALLPLSVMANSKLESMIANTDGSASVA